jgi:hypothetical protein
MALIARSPPESALGLTQSGNNAKFVRCSNTITLSSQSFVTTARANATCAALPLPSGYERSEFLAIVILLIFIVKFLPQVYVLRLLFVLMSLAWHQAGSIQSLPLTNYGNLEMQPISLALQRASVQVPLAMTETKLL